VLEGVAAALDADPKADPPNKPPVDGRGLGVDPKVNPPGGTVVPFFPSNKGLEYKSDAEPFAAGGGFAGVAAAGDGAGLGNKPGEEAIAANSGFTGVAAAGGGAGAGALPTGVPSLNGKAADVPPLAGSMFFC